MRTARNPRAPGSALHRQRRSPDRSATACPSAGADPRSRSGGASLDHRPARRRAPPRRRRSRSPRPDRRPRRPGRRRARPGARGRRAARVPPRAPMRRSRTRSPIATGPSARTTCAVAEDRAGPMRTSPPSASMRAVAQRGAVAERRCGGRARRAGDAATDADTGAEVRTRGRRAARHVRTRVATAAARRHDGVGADGAHREAARTSARKPRSACANCLGRLLGHVVPGVDRAPRRSSAHDAQSRRRVPVERLHVVAEAQSDQRRAGDPPPGRPVGVVVLPVDRRARPGSPRTWRGPCRVVDGAQVVREVLLAHLLAVRRGTTPRGRRRSPARPASRSGRGRTSATRRRRSVASQRSSASAIGTASSTASALTARVVERGPRRDVRAAVVAGDREPLVAERAHQRHAVPAIARLE